MKTTEHGLSSTPEGEAALFETVFEPIGVRKKRKKTGKDYFSKRKRFFRLF